MCAEVKIPYYTRGKTSTDSHKHQIVSVTMPVEFLVTSEENQGPVTWKCALCFMWMNMKESRV